MGIEVMIGGGGCATGTNELKEGATGEYTYEDEFEPINEAEIIGLGTGDLVILEFDGRRAVVTEGSGGIEFEWALL